MKRGEFFVKFRICVRATGPIAVEKNRKETQSLCRVLWTIKRANKVIVCVSCAAGSHPEASSNGFCWLNPVGE